MEGRAGGGSRLGFTLVEVMAVVIVIGILAGVAVPRFFASQGRLQLESDGQTLFLDLQWMRTQTVKTRKRHYMVLDATQREWRIYREEQGNFVCDPAGDSLVRTHEMGVTVEFGFGAGFGALPGQIPSTDGFADRTVPTSGMGVGVASVDDCLEGGVGPGSGSWSNSITACATRGVPDLETGVVYLTSTRTHVDAVAVLYNDLGTQASFQLQRWNWRGGSWVRS
ncbi:MAG: prepilin-type N-terminal cleavage/methylation domain-containing protein [Fibrobacteria bacterium]|nr:prepilin-type N-terminal cleavage/methylation domain-containing protein [Fibrobacteria bacterium]